ncbi:MAG: NAD(P)-dependent oxidoreductase [Acidobacteriaceae bacterium]
MIPNHSMNSSLDASRKSAPPVAGQDLTYILEKTERLWHEVRGRRIFLTGGTGFFGRWLLESFLAANRAFDLQAQAVVLTRSPEQFRRRSVHLAGDPFIELVEGDVRNFAFPAGEFPFVIHAATESVPGPAAGGPEELLSTIVDGTRRCLEFAESHGTKKFLLTSYGAVYGRQPSGMTHIAEDYRGAPDVRSANSVYGEGKRMAELLCAMAAARSGMGCKIARCFAFVGPHLPLDAHFAIGNFIRDAVRDGRIRIQGDGTPRRSYLYAADLAVWLWTMLFQAPSMRPLNVGSGNDRSIREIAEAVAEVVQPGIEIQVAKDALPGAPVQRYVPSVESAKRELNLSEGISLHDAIWRTAVWNRAKIDV